MTYHLNMIVTINGHKGRIIASVKRIGCAVYWLDCGRYIKKVSVSF